MQHWNNILICNPSILSNAQPFAASHHFISHTRCANCWVSSVPLSSLSFSLRYQSFLNKPILEQHWPHTHPLIGSDSPSISSAPEHLTFTQRTLLQALPLPARSLHWGRAAALPALRAKHPQQCWRSWGRVDLAQRVALVPRLQPSARWVRSQTTCGYTSLQLAPLM